MKKLAVIPARYASTRFPGKPLADLLGKPMIQWVFEGTVAAGIFDKVVVATDDTRILECVESFGGNATMTHESHPNGTSRCAEVATLFPEYETVLNVQGDEPLVSAKVLGQITGLIETGAPIASARRKATPEENPNTASLVKVVSDLQGKALYFSRSPVPFYRDQTADDYFIHVGIYGFRRETLLEIVKLPPTPLEQAENLEQLRWLEHGFSIHLTEISEAALSVDTPEDLDDLIAYLKQNP